MAGRNPFYVMLCLVSLVILGCGGASDIKEEEDVWNLCRSAGAIHSTVR